MNSSIKEFNLAIISENIMHINSLSKELREFGITAHYYTKLDEFWVDAKNTNIDYVIVDIEKMSERDLLFKNHPKVQDAQLEYCFFYSNENMSLLPSTYGLSHGGYLNIDHDIHTQLQIVLNKYNERNSLYRANEKLARRLDELDEKTKLWHQDFLTLKHIKTVEDKISQFLSGLEDCPNESIFFDKLIISSDSSSDIDKFGIYYLNKEKRSLVSPKIHTKNAVILPELWVMDSEVDSIDDFALDMVGEATRSLFSKNRKIIKIKRKNKVHALLLLDSQTFSSDKDLRILENKLSTYFSFISPEHSSESKLELNSIYDIAEYFMQSDQSKNQRFIKLNFSSVLENIHNGKNNFFFKSFVKDLQSDLLEMVPGINFSNISLTELVVNFSSMNFDQDYQKVKAVITDMEMWKYFEQSSSLLKSNLTIDMSIINPTIDNLLVKAPNLSHLNKTLNKTNPYLNQKTL